MVLYRRRLGHHLSYDARKPVFGASDQVLYKPGCTATTEELARGLKFWFQEKIGIVLSM